MSNPWYTRVFSALAGQKVRAKPVKDEYALIQTAFDGVKTETDRISALAAAANAASAARLLYTFSSATADADPTSGKLRLDNFAAQTSATTVRIDLLDSNAVDQSGRIDRWDDSTSTTSRGTLLISKRSDPRVYLEFNVTALASPAGYRNVTVNGGLGSSAAPFADGDEIAVEFLRTGERGQTGATGSITYAARSSNTILGLSDKGAFIDITSGTFPQTFDPCATLGAGWWAFYRNSGTGVVTLDPSGAEQIDGRTSFNVYPGECRLLTTNAGATALVSTVITPFLIAYLATGSFDYPPGYSFIGYEMCGAGGGGGAGGSGAASSQNSGSGGGGGACLSGSIPVTLLSSTETVTCGAGGAGVVAGGAGAATAGGTTTFAGISVYGGGGGQVGNNNAGCGGSVLAVGTSGGGTAPTGTLLGGLTANFYDGGSNSASYSVYQGGGTGGVGANTAAGAGQAGSAPTKHTRNGGGGGGGGASSGTSDAAGTGFAGAAGAGPMGRTAGTAGAANGGNGGAGSTYRMGGGGGGARSGGTAGTGGAGGPGAGGGGGGGNANGTGGAGGAGGPGYVILYGVA